MDTPNRLSEVSPRRAILNRRTTLGVLGGSLASSQLPFHRADAQESSITHRRTAKVVHPRGRIPLAFIIDDSTCLVNMGHYCMPQFAQAWPDREIYRQPWKQWPREIPDSFVREFGQWCGEYGVKGKYSIVPYPACVGWLDRFLPGWSKRELDDSLALVRDLMMPNWDIHPEMISHTRVIDLSTGRPMETATPATMENSYPQSDISVDHLASYLAYALKILKNCGLSCEGITTPGGFGNRVKEKLPIAVHQAVRDVFRADLPHYFKYVRDDGESTVPTLEYTDSSKSVERLTVNVPAGTGDWFGSWEGTQRSDPDRYCNRDGTSGRLVDLIRRGEPAVMLCHWPGMYCNGDLSGFTAFQQVVRSLKEHFEDQTIWMKCSEIGRYYAAKQLTSIEWNDDRTLEIVAPIACPGLTLEISSTPYVIPDSIRHGSQRIPLERFSRQRQLRPNGFVNLEPKSLICVDVPQGISRISLLGT